MCYLVILECQLNPHTIVKLIRSEAWSSDRIAPPTLMQCPHAACGSCDNIKLATIPTYGDMIKVIEILAREGQGKAGEAPQTKLEYWHLASL